jgi:glycine cleavage system H protein
MGHDLVTIYWIKAVEYILALSYLPLFVLFWKFVSPRREATVTVRAAAPGWADQLASFFQVPADLFFHRGHTWVRLDGGDTVTVGIDDFAQKLVGPIGSLRLPAVGTSVAQGEPALALNGGLVPMLSPVDGEVVAVNAALEGWPDLVKHAPYTEGWVMKVRSSRLAANLRNLLSGNLAHRWMDTVCESLGAEMSPMELGKVYLDGGQVVDGIARSLSPEAADQLARRFFLTEDGGRHE